MKKIGPTSARYHVEMDNDPPGFGLAAKKVWRHRQLEI
jgi:hypothetical protein